jgi:hypothetical protein
VRSHADMAVVRGELDQVLKCGELRRLVDKLRNGALITQVYHDA